MPFVTAWMASAVPTGDTVPAAGFVIVTVGISAVNVKFERA